MCHVTSALFFKTNCSVSHCCHFLQYANSKLYSFSTFPVWSARCLVGHICYSEKEEPVWLAVCDIFALWRLHVWVSNQTCSSGPTCHTSTLQLVIQLRSSRGQEENKRDYFSFPLCILLLPSTAKLYVTVYLFSFEILQLAFCVPLRISAHKCQVLTANNRTGVP